MGKFAALCSHGAHPPDQRAHEATTQDHPGSATTVFGANTHVVLALPK